MKKIITARNLKNRGFDPYVEKVILNQTIREKDFSDVFLYRLEFSNCLIEFTSFLWTNVQSKNKSRCFL